MKLSKILLAAAATAAMTGTAFADDPPADPNAGGASGTVEAGAGVSVNPDGTPVAADANLAVGVYTKATWPTAFNTRPITLAKGMVEIQGDIFINLSKDNVFKPFAIAPDIYYGVDDKLTVGLTHGIGLCLTGEENGCAKVYNDFGLDALFMLQRKPNMEIAAHGGLDVNAIDPFTLALRVGALIKYTTGKIGIFIDPAITIGITERDGAVDPITMVAVGGNKETISLPIAVRFQSSDKLNVFGRVNLGGISTVNPQGGGAPFDGFGDAFAVGIAVGALFTVNPKLDVGGELVLPFLFGSDLANDIGVDARGLVISANYRL
jgi:hypothetical protein